MKIAVLADIHGNDVAFKAVVDDMKNFHINCVVFLGDLVAKGPQPMECYNRMSTLKPLLWLKGDTEYWLDNAMMDILPTTPGNRVMLDYYDFMVRHMDGPSMDNLIARKTSEPLQLGHYVGLCCHGSPNDAGMAMDPIKNGEKLGEKLKDLKASFVLSGHSHEQYDVLMHGIRMINPGAVDGETKVKKGIAHYAVLEAESSFQVTLREVPYDREQVALVSEQEGFVYKTVE